MEKDKYFAIGYDDSKDPDNVVLQIPLKKIAEDSTNHEYWKMLGFLEDAKSQMAFLIRRKRQLVLEKGIIKPVPDRVLKIH